jgi:hypothetical protein
MIEVLASDGGAQIGMPVDRMQVLAFRADGHNLGRRVPRKQLETAAGAAGIRDAQGSGIVALHARVNDVQAGDLDDLVTVVSARGTNTLVPEADIATFTIGTLPADEESLRVRLKPFLDVLDESGHTATDAVDLAKDVAREALAAGPIDIGALSGALTRGLPELSPMCRGRCGVHHIEQGVFDLVGESGVWRRERAGNDWLYALMPEPTGRDEARAELTRRYLHAYGPSTTKQFAEWCGIATSDAARSLAEVGVVEVAKGWYLLDEDLDRFESPSEAIGVRILPPRDPYLLGRDRATCVPEREVQKRIWKATPTDGVVLARGVPVATWRSKKARTHLTLNVAPFAPLTKTDRAELEAETAHIAAHRGCDSSAVEVA